MAEYNPDLQVVHAFVESLYEAGVSQVVIAPGSRSTPLAIAFVRHAQFKVWTVLDERSAGFFAYGMARVKHEPVALLCTSGTATANLFPAVVEAFQSQVPLLGSIPFLGNLFKQRSVSTSTQELIFFLSPRIIQT